MTGSSLLVEVEGDGGGLLSAWRMFGRGCCGVWAVVRTERLRWPGGRIGGVFGGGGSVELVDAGGVARTAIVVAASSCSTSSSLTSSSLMSSCFTAGAVYGSVLTSSMRDGLRSQSDDSRSIGKADSRVGEKHRMKQNSCG